jgi:hypothetical protein
MTGNVRGPIYLEIASFSAAIIMNLNINTGRDEI